MAATSAPTRDRSATGTTLTAGLFALGALVAAASSIGAIAVTHMDPRGGVTSPLYFVIPGVILAALFVTAAPYTWQTPGRHLLLAFAVVVFAFVVYVFQDFILAYVCLNYGAEPLTPTGCHGSVPNGWLVTLTVLGLAACPAIAVLAFLSTAILGGGRPR
jgi:hypothetical protein